jgi:hypothetical protein
MEKLTPLSAMARRLRVPVKWLREEAIAGRIPHLNAGGRLMFEPGTVEQVLTARAANESPASTGKAVADDKR